jgi:hypothetical protein
MTDTDAVQGERVEGRALDAEVAERVMGLDLSWRRVTLDGTNRDLGPVRNVLAYSTDIAAAWDVVEHMEARCWWFALETFPNPHGINDGATVTARFKATGMPGQHDGVGKAEDAPLAICRAALKALDAASTS